MSFRKFRRKLGWRSSKDDTSSQNQGPVKQNQQQPATQDDGTASGKASSNDPIDSPSPSIPETLSLSDLPPQAHPKEDTTQETAPVHKGSEGNIRELWDLAYGALNDEDEQLILDFEKKIEGDLSAGLSKTTGSRAAKRDWMDTVLTRKMEQVNKNSWKLKFGSSEVLVKDVAKPILGVVSWANDFISKAVSANPSASLAWGGVSLLLPLFLNPSEQAASLAQGLEYISSVIVQSYLWEDLYERYSKSEAGGPSQITYRSALTTLYHHVLKFQMTSYCYYSRSTAYRLGLDSVKWYEWEDLLEKIKEQERVFSAVLNGCRDVRYDEECYAAKQRHEQVISCWQAIGTDVSGLLSAVREAQREKKRTELLQWLCAVDTSSLYNDARDKHQTGTCSWLVEDSKYFKKWMKSPKSLLWLNGKPGSGKSILSSSVIKHLQDNSKSDPGTVLAYFYFNFGSLEQQSLAIMLSSLVKQLCASRPDTPQTIKNLEDYKTKGERPDTKTLEEALIESTRGFSDVFIVVDALDECPTLNGERGKLLASLTRIVAAMPDNLHLFCTSRAEPDISTAINKLLPSTSGTEINLMKYTKGVSNDMSTYINSILDSDDYHSWPGELKADAKRLLIEKADGMFQYIVCQFEGLRNLRSKSLISSALENLPKGLDATYDRLLRGIDPKFQAQLLSLLKWLAFSSRTLKIQEVAEIFIFHPERAIGVDTEERLFEPEEVLRYLSSLVTVQKVKKKATGDQNHWIRGTCDEESEQATTHVRLAHFTVKEYLISDRICKGPAAYFSFTEDDAHLHISHCCLVYHLQKTDKMWEEGGFPLGSYATRYWAWHLEMAPRRRWTSQVLRFALSALAVRSKSLRTFIKAGIYVGTGVTYPSSDVKEALFLLHPDCCTAALGFLNLTDMLLSAASETYDYLTQMDLVNVLSEATESGKVSIVQLVLDKGAHANPRALSIAVSQNHPEIVELLLYYGAGTYKSISYLTGAVSSIVLKVIGSVSDHVSKRTRLAEHARSLQLLIDNGVGINKQCAIHGTALSNAAHQAMSYHEARYFVDFLIQQGADVNAPCSVFGSPLQAACSGILFSNFSSAKRSHERGYHSDKEHDLDDKGVVMTLLEMGAEVNAQGGKYGNALQAASYAGNNAAVRLLLDRGADQNMPGGHFGTSLQAACAEKRWGIASLLIHRGADLDVQGGVYGNALQAACYNATASRKGQLWPPKIRSQQRRADKRWPHKKRPHMRRLEERRRSHSRFGIVQRLLELGANVNAAGGEFGSALQAASSSWYGEATVSLLLSKGADVNKQGGMYGTAVQGACAKGRISVVRLLLAHGCNLNIECGKYGTALQAACAKGRISVVRLLLERGCNMNVEGGKYGTALQAACASHGTSKKYFRLVRLLIQHGADVHIQGGVYGSAWHAAAEQFGPYARATMKLLLNHGADVNDRRGRNGTALQAAVEYSQNRAEDTIPRVRFLLKNGANINERAGMYGFPLQSACMGHRYYREFGRQTVLEYMLANCPDIDVNITGGKFGTALQAAAYEGNIPAVLLLLGDDKYFDAYYDSDSDAHDDAYYAPRYEANINARGGEYGSALDAAVCAGHANMVEVLLNHGADADARGGKYGSALNAAVIKGYWDLVNILLKAGAQLDWYELLISDKEWLEMVESEDGWDAIERYSKFWEKNSFTSPKRSWVGRRGARTPHPDSHIKLSRIREEF